MSLPDDCKAAAARRLQRTSQGRTRLLLWLFVLAALAAALWWLSNNFDAPALQQWRADPAAGLRQIPFWAFVLGFIVLPALGVPLLLFYFTVGAFTPGLAWALALAWTCMAANMAFSYALARLFAAPLRKLLGRFGYRVPALGREAEWRLIVMMRISPIPWLTQSWLLTLAGTRFWPYLLYGVPVQAVIGFGVVVFGGSLLSGDGKWALIGLSLVLVVMLALPLLRRHAAAR